MIETPRLRLRAFVPSDWKDIKSVLSDPEANHYVHSPTWSKQKLRPWFDRCIENSKQQDPDVDNWAIVLKDSGTVIGWFGIIRPDKPVTEKERTLSFTLGRQYWGHGYMVEVLEAIFAYEFTFKGTHRISGACITQDAPLSREMEKAGMVYEGSFLDTDSDGRSVNRHRYAVHQHEYFSTGEQD
jgi:ribosomal-protein-alanine N-acetyltransferase